MPSGVTNRGKFLFGQGYFQGTLPANIYAALVTETIAPTADTDTLAQLEEIAAGNGYTSGGIMLNRDDIDFTVAEDDTADVATVTVRDLSYDAAGGTLPSDGVGARWLVLTTDEATVGERQVIAYHDLQSPRVVSDGQSLILKSTQIRLVEPTP